MTRTEEFKFDLHDRVIIREIQRPGIIVGLLIDHLGVQYHVRYWDNSDKNYVWLQADEIEPR